MEISKLRSILYSGDKGLSKKDLFDAWVNDISRSYLILHMGWGKEEETLIREFFTSSVIEDWNRSMLTSYSAEFRVTFYEVILSKAEVLRKRVDKTFPHLKRRGDIELMEFFELNLSVKDLHLLFYLSWERAVQDYIWRNWDENKKAD